MVARPADHGPDETDKSGTEDWELTVVLKKQNKWIADAIWTLRDILQLILIETWFQGKNLQIEMNKS